MLESIYKELNREAIQGYLLRQNSLDVEEAEQHFEQILTRDSSEGIFQMIADAWIQCEKGEIDIQDFIETTQYWYGNLVNSFMVSLIDKERVPLAILCESVKEAEPPKET